MLIMCSILATTKTVLLAQKLAVFCFIKISLGRGPARAYSGSIEEKHIASSSSRRIQPCVFTNRYSQYLKPFFFFLNKGFFYFKNEDKLILIWYTIESARGFPPVFRCKFKRFKTKKDETVAELSVFLGKIH